MKVEYAKQEYISSWMKLVQQVRLSFPGLETDQGLNEYKDTVLRFMSDDRALCVRKGTDIVGVLLFSKKHNMICCLAVASDLRRQGIASALLSEAINNLDKSQDITVSTFREGDPKGIAPRALYRAFGFVEGDLIEEFGYPNQRFILPATMK